MIRSRISLVLCAALGLAVMQTSKLSAGPNSSDNFGMGIEADGGVNGYVGNLSLTGKYWFDGIHAIDMDLGGGYGGVTVGADYLWHNFRVFRRPFLALYYGVGGYSNIYDNGFNNGYGNGPTSLGLGVRGKIGIDWLIPRSPWEVYGEAVPALNVVGGVGFGVGLGVGGRYYF